jgi:hypothetical protein
MNQVKLSGTLTRDPFKADKGWVGATLAVVKPGTTYALWVSLYVPSGEASKMIGKLHKDDILTVEGELDEGKDKDGVKKLQVKVLNASLGSERHIERSRQTSDEATRINDSDLPDWD